MIAHVELLRYKFFVVLGRERFLSLQKIGKWKMLIKTY